MSSIVFKCPRCGGAFNFNEGDRTAVCGFCGATSALVGDSGVNRLLLQERIDLNTARTNVRKMLAEESGDHEYSSSFSFKTSELLFLPFWRIRGIALGWHWQELENFVEEVDYDENGAKYVKTVKMPNKRIFEQIAKPLDITAAAGDYRPFGRLRIGLAGAVLSSEIMDLPATAKRGTVVSPLKGIGQARSEALALARGGGGSSLAVRQFSRADIAGEWAALIYYPVWRLTFAKGNRIYPVSVDAVNGDVTCCCFPLQSKSNALRPLALVALVVWGLSIKPIFGIFVIIVAAVNVKMIDSDTLIRFFFALPEAGKRVERG